MGKPQDRGTGHNAGTSAERYTTGKVRNHALLCDESDKRDLEARNLARLVQYTAEFRDSFEGRSPFTEAVLCELHRISVDGIYPCGGKSRTNAVYGVEIEANFVPASAADVILGLPLLLEQARNWPDKVSKLLAISVPDDELTAKIMVASDIFYDFLIMHPFNGGNGRVSRALLHLLLCEMEVLTPPREAYSAMAYRRKEYFEVLREADGGDRIPLYRYISRCVWQASIDYLCNDLTTGARGTYLLSKLPPASARFVSRPKMRMGLSDKDLTRSISRLAKDLTGIREREQRRSKNQLRDA